MSFTAGAILSAYALGGIGSLIGAGSKAVGLAGSAMKVAEETGELTSKAGLLNRGISAIGKGLSKVSAFSDEASNAALFSKNEFGFGEKLLSKTANTLKGASSAFDGTESTQALANATKWENFIGGASKLGGTSTRLAVGAMYEGGTEANDYLKQADTKDTQEYYDKFGQPQTQQDLDKFNAHKKEFADHSLNVANALFLGNVALVGAADLAVFPSVFGKGVNETIKDARKLVGERVVEGGTEAFVKGSERKGLAKIGKAFLTGFEPLYAEGIQEEGGQNFMKSLALDYIDKHYNPDSAKNNYDLANSLGNAFSQAYLTTDG
jgi:hypothetical protein